MSQRHHKHPEHIPRSGPALLGAIALNVTITVAQFVAGFMTGFISLVADAAHNLSDVAALALAYFGERAGAAPASKRATFGFKRVEVLMATLSALALGAVAMIIARDAWERFHEPADFKHESLFFVVAGIGLVANLGSALILHRTGVRSLNMRMAVTHLAFDAASSATVIIGGALIVTTGWTVIDPALALGISALIFWSAFDALRQSWRIFMEISPTGVDFDSVITAIESHPAAINAHDLHIWSLSSTEIALSCHVTVRADDLTALNRIIAELNELLHKQFGVIHSTLQIETEACARPDVVCAPQSNSRQEQHAAPSPHPND